MSRIHRSSAIAGLLAGVLMVVFVRASGTASAQTSPGPFSSELLPEMQHHFSQVLLIFQAVGRGDLAAVHAPATELASIPIPPGVPPTAAAYVATIRETARRAAEASTLTDAARA